MFSHVPYVAGGMTRSINCILGYMKWYFVTKKIGGRPYLYRQRTYREGGKVRTISQYVGPRADVATCGISRDAPASITQPMVPGTAAAESVPYDPIDDYKPGQLHIPWDRPPKPRRNAAPKANWTDARLKWLAVQNTLKQRKISLTALQAEQRRVVGHLDRMGLDGDHLATIRLEDGWLGGYRRYRNGYRVKLARDRKGSGRNRFKRNYRLALAHAMLDQVYSQSPSQYDRLRTAMDSSWFNSKLLITSHLLKSGDPKRFWWTMQFLWSGKVPTAMEKKLGRKGFRKISEISPAGWRDEAAHLIADVIHKGYKASIKRYARDRSRTRSNALRALNAYQKLTRLQRLTSKGRKVWKRYKRHESDYLMAHHRHSRLKMLEPFVGNFHA